MSVREQKVYSRAFKLEVIQRMEAAENIASLSREMGVPRQMMYRWRERFHEGGAAALRGKGGPARPRTIPVAVATVVEAAERAVEAAQAGGGSVDELAIARRRVAELERLVGRQQVDLDFFRRALRHSEGTRQSSDGPGAPASTISSER